jgi:hypothetical protein
MASFWTKCCGPSSGRVAPDQGGLGAGLIH